MGIVDNLKQIPFLRLVIPLIAGILFSLYVYRIDNNDILYIVILASIFLLVIFNSLKLFYSNYGIRWLFGVLINISLFFIACLLVNNKLSGLENSDKYSAGYIIGTINERPDEKEKIIKTIVDVEAINQNEQWEETSGKILMFFQKDSNSLALEIGDRIIFKPNISDIRNSGNPSEFDYEKYLMFHLISQQSFLKTSDWKKIDSKNNTIKVFAEKIRDKFLSILKSNGLTGSEYSVVSALTVGYKNELDNNIKRAYSSSGAMHVLAVSGLHVGILFVIFSNILFFLKKIKQGKVLKSIILLILLWSYALITGLSPSVLRATTMFTFVIIGQSLNRPTNIYNSITASAFVLIIFNPLIITEVGFQLSYLAVIGIIYFQPKIYKLLYFKNYLIDKIWALVSVSLAAQISTTPISLYYFHQFPNYFIVTNIVVIPIVTIVIYIALILFVLSGIEVVSFWIGKTLEFVVKILNESAIFIEKLPYSLSENISISLNQTILLYLLIILFSAYIYQFKKKYLFSAFATIVLILSIEVFYKVENVFQRKLIVYNVNKQSAINIIDGNENLLISSFSANEDMSKLVNLTKNNWLNLGLDKEKHISINTLDKKFLFTNNLIVNNTNAIIFDKYIGFYKNRILVANKDFKIPQFENRVKINYLVITNNSIKNVEDLNKSIETDIVILDSSNSVKYSEYITEFCKKNNILCHNTKINGAFVVDL